MLARLSLSIFAQVARLTTGVYKTELCMRHWRPVWRRDEIHSMGTCMTASFAVLYDHASCCCPLFYCVFSNGFERGMCVCACVRACVRVCVFCLLLLCCCCCFFVVVFLVCVCVWKWRDARVLCGGGKSGACECVEGTWRGCLCPRYFVIKNAAAVVVLFFIEIIVSYLNSHQAFTMLPLFYPPYPPPSTPPPPSPPRPRLLCHQKRCCCCFPLKLLFPT